MSFVLDSMFAPLCQQYLTWVRTQVSTYILHELRVGEHDEVIEGALHTDTCQLHKERALGSTVIHITERSSKGTSSASP